jgi:drug/metabolite transporter (DMT)-like permease
MAVRLYGRKHQDGGMFFNAIICAFAALFLLITDKNGLQFPKELFLYSISGAVTTAVGFYTAYLAFKYGSFILTKLISSFYSVIVIAYGIVFLREPADLFGYIGIVLFLISSVMVNLKKEDVSEKKEFSVKWLVCAVLCAVGNALLVIIMRSQQIKFDGAYDNEYMIVNSLGAAILLFAIGLITERKAKLALRRLDALLEKIYNGELPALLKYLESEEAK